MVFQRIRSLKILKISKKHSTVIIYNIKKNSQLQVYETKNGTQSPLFLSGLVQLCYNGIKFALPSTYLYVKAALCSSAFRRSEAILEPLHSSPPLGILHWIS